MSWIQAINKTISAIAAKIRNEITSLQPTEAAVLRLQVENLKKIAALTAKRVKYRKSQAPASKPRAKWTPEKGIWIDGIRCCRLCRRPLPHRTKDEYRFHMLAAKRRWMQQAAKASWTRRGYDKLVKSSVASRKRRSIDRKLAILKEECPLLWAKLTRDDAIRMILNYRSPGKGHMYGPVMWRKHLRRHFR